MHSHGGEEDEFKVSTYFNGTKKGTTPRTILLYRIAVFGHALDHSAFETNLCSTRTISGGKIANFFLVLYTSLIWPKDYGFLPYVRLQIGKRLL